GERAVRSQTELGELLAAEGFQANQGTLSRDLRQLGIVKGPDGYAVPDAVRGAVPTDPLGEAVRQWLRRATTVAHQVVLRTPAGGAQPLAVALDRAALRGVVGTLAGDDTSLVVCAGPSAARRVQKVLERHLPR